MGKKTRKEPEKLPPLEEFLALFMPLTKLTEIGIQNNKEPKEIVEYFAKVAEEFVEGMERLEGLGDIV